MRTAWPGQYRAAAGKHQLPQPLRLEQGVVLGLSGYRSPAA